jgi:4-hydroxy-2-oxoheptanedioate aldolase
MQQNQVKAKLQAGGWVSGPILGEVRSIGTIKYMALAGHDFVFIDMEHAMFDMDVVHNLVQYALTVGITPLVRVPDLQYHLIARALDSGAMGIIVPRVDDRQQAEAAVSFAKYPPVGRRGAGGMARNAYEAIGAKDAVETMNRETMVILQIESTEGLANLEEIAAVPGVDVLCFGPHDLSISLGCHGNYDAPEFLAAMQRVVDVATPRGIQVGMVEQDASKFARWYAMGMRFFCCNTDGNMIAQGSKADVATLRRITGQ